MNFAITTQEKHARERLADRRPIENGMSVNKSYKLRKRPQYYVAQVSKMERKRRKRAAHAKPSATMATGQS